MGRAVIDDLIGVGDRGLVLNCIECSEIGDDLIGVVDRFRILIVVRS